MGQPDHRRLLNECWIPGVRERPWHVRVTLSSRRVAFAPVGASATAYCSGMHSPLSATADDAESLAASALRLIRERAPDVLNAVDDGIYCLDRAGRTIFV